MADEKDNDVPTGAFDVGSRKLNAIPLDLMRFISYVRTVVPVGCDGTPVYALKRKGYDGFPPCDEAGLIKLLRSRPENDSSYYVSTALSRRGEDGSLNNKTSSFVCSWCLVLDDVGTKGKSYEETYAKLKPTWVIESSAGNYQFGYVYTEACFDFGAAIAAVKSVYGSTFSDKGGGLANKLVRVPAGVRNKTINGLHDAYKVKLLELNADVRHAMHDIVAAFPCTTPERVATAVSSSIDDILFDDSGNVVLVDGVTAALKAEGLYELTAADGTVKTRCPWGDEHTEGKDDLAAYYPFGVGATSRERDMRGYRCHHGHCANRHAGVLIDWLIARRHYIALSAELEVMLQSWAHIKSRDLFVSLGPIKQEMQPMTFRNAHPYDVQVSEDRWMPAGVACHKLTKLRFNNYTFAPGKPRVFIDNTAVTLNSYKHFAPLGAADDSRMPLFDELLAHILPVERERSYFLDWVAHKLQRPGERGPMVLMVTDGVEGVGRSSVARLIERLFGHYAGQATYKQLHDSYTGWLSQKLFITIDEVYDGGGSFKDNKRIGEELKELIDTGGAGTRTINVKYGGQYDEKLVVNVLGLSNHLDAMQLTKENRRIVVLRNSDKKWPTTRGYELQGIKNDDGFTRALYDRLMARDITEYDPSTQFLTLAKAEMQQNAIEDITIALDHVLSEENPYNIGDVIWQSHLRALALRAITELCDFTRDELEYYMLVAVKKRFRRLAPLSPSDLKHGGRIKCVPTRVVRNIAKWQGSLTSSPSGNAALTHELHKSAKAAQSSLE